MHSLEGCQGPSTGEIFLLSSIWSLSSVSSPNFHQPHHKTDQPWLIKSNIVIILITKHNTKHKTYSVICNDGTVESLLRILGLFLNDGLWVKAICWDCTSVYFNLQWSTDYFGSIRSQTFSCTKMKRLASYCLAEATFTCSTRVNFELNGILFVFW